MSILSILLLTLAGIPIVLYPIVLLAGVMSLAGHQPKKQSHSLKIHAIFFKIFILLTLLYPIPLMAGIKLTKKVAAENSENELLYAASPLAYLLVIILFYFIVMRLERKAR